MATGDILSLQVNPNGHSGVLQIEGFVTGATYSLGTAPANYKGVLTVTSKGFDSAGSATTTVRTVYIRFIAYLEPPPANSFVADEAAPGSDLEVTVVFSEPIYAKDKAGGGNSGTDVVANIAGGICVNSSGGSESSNAAVALTVTNNSTLAYPKAVARFLTPPFSGSNDTAAAVLGNGAFNVDVHAFAMYGIAAVKFTLADGTVTRTDTQTAMAWRADLNCPSYRVADAGANFTQSANVTCRVQAYPRVGDTTEIRDSNDNAFADSIEFATLPLGVCDRLGTYGITYAAVNSSTGNDTTGVASNVAATAEATPCLTIGGAMVKIAAYNNTNYSRNTVDAGVILLIGGGHLYGRGGSTPATHTGTSVTITRSSATSRANAQITGPNATSRYGAQHTRIYDCSIVPSSGANQNIGFVIAGSTIVVSDVTATGQGTTTKMFDHDTTGKFDHWWKNVTLTAYTSGYASGNGMCSLLCVNCTTDASDASSGAFGGVRWVAGCTSTGTAGSVLKFGGAAWTNTGNVGAAYLQAYTVTGDFVAAGAAGNANDLFLVNCLAERTGAGGSALVEISDANMDNVHIWHCTLVGNRTNIETDIANPLVDKTLSNFSLRNSVFTQLAVQSHSDDTAMTMLGNRALNYGVTVRDVHEEDDALGFAPWPEDYGWTEGTDAGFVDDQSFTGGNGGNGDYQPDVGSTLLNRIPAGSALVPCDLFGVAVPNDGTGDIGAIQEDAPVAPVGPKAGATLSMMGIGR